MDISIIVCSRKATISQQLADNVAQTIGPVQWEWVIIDNTTNSYSLFEAYNLGVKRAHGDILCFMHDDIMFKSSEWGRIVMNTLEKADACAVIGNTYARRAPSYTGNTGFGVILYEDEQRGLIKENADDTCPILLFDGMWFCIRHKCFDSIAFDEHYDGFHFYDMDIALQLQAAGFQTVFAPGVLIWHRTGGQFDKTWLNNSYLFYDKWHRQLPCSVAGAKSPSPRKAFHFELEAIYTSLRLIVRHRQWHLLPRFYMMAVNTLRLPMVAIMPIVLYHHICSRFGV